MPAGVARAILEGTLVRRIPWLSVENLRSHLANAGARVAAWIAVRQQTTTRDRSVNWFRQIFGGCPSSWFPFPQRRSDPVGETFRLKPGQTAPTQQAGDVRHAIGGHAAQGLSLGVPVLVEC